MPPEEASKVYLEKIANDSRTFETAKLAAGVMGSMLQTGKNVMGSPFGKGLGMAAGAAIPTVMAGNMMSTHAAEQARNKALQTGMGLAGIGASLYGIHHMMQPGQKMASEEEKDYQEALHKLASIGYLDELLGTAELDEKSSEGARKLAAEIRLMNREYCIEILRNLIG